MRAALNKTQFWNVEKEAQGCAAWKCFIYQSQLPPHPESEVSDT